MIQEIMLMQNLEKTSLKVRFIPIVCSTPLIYAHKAGLFARRGLDVELKSAPGWSGVKELMAHDMVDAAHMLAPMPLACHLGIDGKRSDIALAAIQNVNGQALTLSSRHAGLTSVRDMKGFVFGVPYRFSMHYYLLCHYLAANGVHPLKDVTIKEVSPPRMPYYLEKGWVDGVFAPEPFNQIPVLRGIGFIHRLSREIWAGHPCCCFAVHRRFIAQYPNTYRAMLEAVLEAQLYLDRATPEALEALAVEICDAEHLNQPDPTPVQQVLTGRFPDGTGRQLDVPDRVGFVPHAWTEYGVWILTQMQRWQQLGIGIDYREIVESVFQTSETAQLADLLGFPAQSGPQLSGIAPFDGTSPQKYLQSLPKTSLRKRAVRKKRHALPDSAAVRLMQIVKAMAKVAGGESDVSVDILSSDEIGLVEQAFNEMVLNNRFASEALAEEKERLQAATAQLLQEVEARKEAKAVVAALNARLKERVATQAQAILELSTPAIKFWKGAILIPLVGVVDTERAHQLMESMLESITEAQAQFVIVDLTGVPAVDTQVANHLLKAVRAARMLGAQVTLSGMSPVMAQIITALGVDLTEAHQTGTLESAIRHAISRLSD